MASSQPGCTGTRVSRQVIHGKAAYARSPGSLGKNDAADPNVHKALPGDTPGPVGTSCDAASAIVGAPKSRLERAIQAELDSEQKQNGSITGGIAAFIDFVGASYYLLTHSDTVVAEGVKAVAGAAKAVVDTQNQVGQFVGKGAEPPKPAKATTITPAPTPAQAAKDQSSPPAKAPLTTEERRKRHEKMMHDDEVMRETMFILEPSVSEGGIRQ